MQAEGTQKSHAPSSMFDRMFANGHNIKHSTTNPGYLIRGSEKMYPSPCHFLSRASRGLHRLQLVGVSSPLRALIEEKKLTGGTLFYFGNFL